MEWNKDNWEKFLQHSEHKVFEVDFYYISKYYKSWEELYGTFYVYTLAKDKISDFIFKYKVDNILK